MLLTSVAFTSFAAEILVALALLNLPDTALIEVALTLLALISEAALMFVPDIVGESISVALKSVNLADTALTEVPEIVTPRADVALKSTNLVVAEKFAAPVTVPPDNGK